MENDGNMGKLFKNIKNCEKIMKNTIIIAKYVNGNNHH